MKQTKMKVEARKIQGVESSSELVFTGAYFLIFLELPKMLIIQNILHKQQNSSESNVTRSSSPQKAQRNKNRSLLRCGSPKPLNSQKKEF